jgi:hypothetical protein
MDGNAARLPQKLVDVLENNKTVVDAYVVEKSALNKHKMHTLLSTNGFTNSRERERYISMVAHSRRWGRV